MLSRVKQGVDLRNRYAFGAVKDFLNSIAGAQLAFLDDTQIEAGPVVRYHQRWHLWVFQPDAEPVTGIARLGDLDNGTANPEAIANADVSIGQPVHCEVFAENPMHEIRPHKVVRPVAVRNQSGRP